MEDRENFSFCIGTPWEVNSTNINVYTYGATVFHGDKEYAEGVREFIEERANSGTKTKKNYHIYKLVKINGKI